MKNPKDTRWWLVPTALLVGLLLVGGTVLLGALSHQPFGHYSRDIKSLSTDAGAALPPLVGGLGLVNMMVWASAGSMAALAAALSRPRRRWLLGFSGLTLLLALDDALLLHEEVGPQLGLPEKGFYLLYAALGVLLLRGAFRAAGERTPAAGRWRFSPLSLPPAGRAFVLGLVLLGVSVLVDQLTHGRHLWEDAPKLLGSLVWLTVPVLELPEWMVWGGGDAPLRPTSDPQP
jgi:hypothetical protein